MPPRTRRIREDERTYPGEVVEEEGERWSAFGREPTIIAPERSGDPAQLRLTGSQITPGVRDAPTMEEIEESQRLAGLVDLRGIERPEDPLDVGGIALYEQVEQFRDRPHEADILGDFGEPFDPTDIYEQAASAQAAEAFADPEGLAAAREGLAMLQQMADEGFLPHELERIQQMGQMQDTALRGGELAAMEEQARRGIQGADIERMYALNASQAAAQQGALRDLETAAAAEERKRFATTAAGRLGADIAAQTFQQDYMRGQARDAANRAVAEARQRYNEWMANRDERIKQFEIAQRQGLFGAQAGGVGNMLDWYGFTRPYGVNEAVQEFQGVRAQPYESNPTLDAITGIANLGTTAYDVYRGVTKQQAKDEKEAAAFEEAFPEPPSFQLEDDETLQYGA